MRFDNVILRRPGEKSHVPMTNVAKHHLPPGLQSFSGLANLNGPGILT